MEMALKQRLVGAAVIIAIAVIVIPMLLDGSGEYVISEIPPRPIPVEPDRGMILDDIPPVPARSEVAISDSELPLTQQAADELQHDAGKESPREEPQKAAATEAEVKPPQVQASSPKVAELTSESGEVAKETVGVAAWVVQIGSFSEQSKANALRDRMRKLGFKTFVEPFRSQQRLLYRVRIGPHLERKQAEQTLAQLQQKSEIRGYITRHP